VEVPAFIGLGSNLGERLANLQAAVDLLDESPLVRVARSSRVYETAPVGGPRQPDYLNAVLEVRTELDPGALLRTCHQVEAALGRVREERWGPRTIDLDILGYDRAEVQEPDLTIPHPRMHERAFVLMPLLELTADPLLPGGRSVASLRLPPNALTEVRPFAPPLRVTP
jgi:2-amino-4-hydroxy-6-hydroxymethyldihydropteridine diphosphokinase